MANSARREITQPAPTIAFGHDANSARWCYERPATTIVGSFKPEIVAAPGYRTTVSRQNAEGSVRVSVAEAGLLQSFPGDMPWQGAKGKRYLQVGNAVPPGLAIPVLGEATGLPWQEASKTYRDSIYTL
jgi:DNA (cytosine-5)-methyltransferase 1